MRGNSLTDDCERRARRDRSRPAQSDHRVQRSSISSIWSYKTFNIFLESSPSWELNWLRYTKYVPQAKLLRAQLSHEEKREKKGKGGNLYHVTSSMWTASSGDGSGNDRKCGEPLLIVAVLTKSRDHEQLADLIGWKDLPNFVLEFGWQLVRI